MTRAPAAGSGARTVASTTCWECSTGCGSLVNVQDSLVTGVAPNPDHPATPAAAPAGEARPDIEPGRQLHQAKGRGPTLWDPGTVTLLVCCLPVEPRLEVVRDWFR